MYATFYTPDGLVEVAGGGSDSDEVVWSAHARDAEHARELLAEQFGNHGREMPLDVSDLPPARGFVYCGNYDPHLPHTVGGVGAGGPFTTECEGVKGGDQLPDK